MAHQIATEGVHHFRLTVTDVDRAVTFYTGVLGFMKLLDLNPGAFLSNGKVGLGIGPPSCRRGIAQELPANGPLDFRFELAI